MLKLQPWWIITPVSKWIKKEAKATPKDGDWASDHAAHKSPYKRYKGWSSCALPLSVKVS